MHDMVYNSLCMVSINSWDYGLSVPVHVCGHRQVESECYTMDRSEGMSWALFLCYDDYHSEMNQIDE